MFEMFNFSLTQLRRVKSVMDDFPAFRPDDLTPDAVELMITDAETVLGTAQGGWTDLNLARGVRDNAAKIGHDTSVDVYAVMKRRFRKDAASLDAINHLPVGDDTVDEILSRMELTAKLWGKLPNPPGSATPFKAWATMGKTEYELLKEALFTALDDEKEKDEEWDKVNGAMKAKGTEIDDFVTTALVQGRSQFEEGTEERAAVDGIPTGPETPLPSQAEVTLDAPPGPGTMALGFASDHATTIRLFRRLIGEPDFPEVEIDLAPGAYQKTGLPPGNYEVKIAGENSRGIGPESEPISVTVT